ncbi:GGDEF domain-containing protein [Frankia sp. Hr75.2]|nr:GGDEF domain-containing protein [Frankia sp. Hr75.2]
MGATAVAWDGELFDRLEIGLTLTSVASRRVRRVNAAACRILGRARADLVGAAWESLRPPTEVDGWADVCRQLSGEQLAERQKVQFVRPDGNLAHVVISTNIVDARVHDDSGGSYCFGQILDITDGETARYQLQLILENSPVSMTLTDMSGRVVAYAGGPIPAFVEDMKAAAKSSVFEVFSYVPLGLDLVRRAMDGEPGSGMTYAHGRYQDLHMRPIRNSAGEVAYVASISTDVTEREHARSEQSAVSELARQAIRTVEPARFWNHAASVLARRLDAAVTVHTMETDREPELAAAVGTLPPAAVTARAVEETLPAAAPGRETLRDEATCGHAGRVGQWRTLSVPLGQPGAPTAVLTLYRADPAADPATTGGRRDGQASPEPSTAPFAPGEVEFVDTVASVLGSAAVRFAMEREARYRALHDDLTDLPNRSALLDHLNHSLERSRDNRSGVGVVFVDLDGFKAVNDTFGHNAGDDVLRQVATRLRSSVRPDDVVARLAGDEFAVLCEHVGGLSEVEVVAHRVLTALAEPITLSGDEVTVTASVGVAVSGTELLDPDRLLNASDIAMYAAKRAGPGRYAVHQPTTRTDTATFSARQAPRDGRGTPPATV